MKRLIGSVTLLLVLCCYMWSCEKDDLCATDTPTTPSLLIEFYASDNPAAPNPVTNLRYFVEGSKDTIFIKGSAAKIRVPLRVDGTSTKWGLILYTNPNGVDTYNTDFLEFKYTTTQVYVSRACGFKTLFKLDDPTAPNPVLTDGDKTLWIDEADIVNTNVETEEKAHVKIYF